MTHCAQPHGDVGELGHTMTSPLWDLLGTELKVPLGEPAEQHRGEVHRPDAIVALFQPDVFIRERSPRPLSVRVGRH